MRGATAYATPADRPIMGIVPHADTDADGHFVIQRLRLGKFRVSASKEEEGYPELASNFHVGMTKEVVLTQSNQPLAYHCAWGQRLALSPARLRMPLLETCCIPVLNCGGRQSQRSSLEALALFLTSIAF